MIYNVDNAVMQWCDGTQWIGLPGGGGGGAGCSNPAAAEGAVVYNQDFTIIQWCDGTDWIGFPKPPIPKTVFVTSTTYDGDLKTAGGASQWGVTGADNICNSRASAAVLSGTYKAWIGGMWDWVETGPTDRFTKAGPLGQDFHYTLTTGTVIATSWTDLTDGTLAAPIERDEFGAAQTGNVWSNAGSDGTFVDAGVDCSDWLTSSGGSNRGRAGSSTATDANWADTTNPQCNNTLRLYCFEQ